MMSSFFLGKQRLMKLYKSIEAFFVKMESDFRCKLLKVKRSGKQSSVRKKPNFVHKTLYSFSFITLLTMADLDPRHPILEAPTPDLYRTETVKLYAPIYSSTNDSLAVRSLTNHQRFKNWTKNEHLESFKALQRIQRLWKKSGAFDSFLIVGKTSPNLRSETFEWEVVPFDSEKSEYTKHFKLIWNRAFGNRPSPESKQIKRAKKARETLAMHSPRPPKEKKPCTQEDPFCNEEVLQKQRILSGKKVDLLYDYAPGTILEEAPHFLIITKEPRESFTDLTAEEYLEAMVFTQKIAEYYADKNPQSSLFLLQKSGEAAGETIPHWHLHVIAIEEDMHLPDAQFPCSRSPMSCTRLSSPFLHIKNSCKEIWQGCRNLAFLILPDQKLSDEELKARVAHYREEFQFDF